MSVFRWRILVLRCLLHLVGQTWQDPNTRQLISDAEMWMKDAEKP